MNESESGIKCAQAYYYPSSTQTASPLPIKETSFEGLNTSEKLLRVEEVQEAYIDSKERCVQLLNTLPFRDLFSGSLVHAIDSTKAVLEDLRVFNKEDWVVDILNFRNPPNRPIHPSAPAHCGGRFRLLMTRLSTN